MPFLDNLSYSRFSEPTINCEELVAVTLSAAIPYAIVYRDRAYENGRVVDDLAPQNDHSGGSKETVHSAHTRCALRWAIAIFVQVVLRQLYRLLTTIGRRPFSVAASCFNCFLIPRILPSGVAAEQDWVGLSFFRYDSGDQLPFLPGRGWRAYPQDISCIDAEICRRRVIRHGIWDDPNCG
jgi:hypothetical protein